MGAAVLPRSAAGGWDRGYEVKAVAILSAGFGLVGLDRFIILPLLPQMMHDLHLDYQELGFITSAFSVAWGLASLTMGRLSDRIGRRAVLIPALIAFSLLAGFSGLTVGVGSLILVRVLMGLSEGAYTPVSVSATLEASKPSRRGFNLGVQQILYAVLGLAAGPILATELLTVLPSWRWVFVCVSLPGLLLAALAWRTLRNTQGALAPSLAEDEPAPSAAGAAGGWREALAHRNVPLSMAGMCCMIATLLVATTLAPVYLVDVLHLAPRTMGWVLSGVGFGGFVGQLLLPGVSDWVGRKPVVLACYAGTFACLTLFLRLGPSPWPLFAALFGLSLFNNSMICLNVGPITCEAAPAALTATATGLVIGVGEALGGGFVPSLAGYVAKTAGLQSAFRLALVVLAVGFLAALFLRETAPRRVRPALTEALA